MDQPVVIPPASLKSLRKGQVLDRDPVTGMVISVVSNSGRTVTIRQANKAQTMQRTYDAATGVLREFRAIKKPTNSMVLEDVVLQLTATR